MSELRAEAVREALEIWDGYPEGDSGDPVFVIVDAARAWLASQATTEGRYVEPAGSSEQTPDYEAAAKVLADNDGIEILEWHDDLARRVVDAAFVGFHPQPADEMDDDQDTAGGPLTR